MHGVALDVVRGVRRTGGSGTRAGRTSSSTSSLASHGHVAPASCDSATAVAFEKKRAHRASCVFSLRSLSRLYRSYAHSDISPFEDPIAATGRRERDRPRERARNGRRRADEREGTHDDDVTGRKGPSPGEKMFGPIAEIVAK